MTVSGGGRLVRLELQNFKSYHGLQVIGPFDDNFVSIIGPNGAGKSNLMDALSFVLGIQSAQLRSTNLADLIYRNGETSASHANVTAVYVKPDGAQTLFSRRVSKNGHSEYRVDGKTISYADYCRLWEGENVLIKARNFLVFQGDVEALASKSPKDLTRLFEQISGSEEYRADYERCKMALDRALEDSTLNFNRRKGLGAELKQVQEQREDVMRYEKLMTERAALQVEFHLWKLFHIEENARKVGAQIELKEAELSEIEKTVQRLEGVWKDAKKKAAKGHKDILTAEKNLKLAQKQLTDEAPQSVQLQDKLKFFHQRRTALEENQRNAHHDAQKCSDDIKTIEQELQEVVAAAETFESTASKRLEASNINDDLLAEYNQLREEASQKVLKEKLKLESLERKLGPEYLNKRSLQDKLTELESARGRVENEGSRLEGKRLQLADDAESLDGQVEETLREISTSQAQKLKLEQTEAELTERVREIMSRLMQAKADKQESEREIKLRATLESLKRIFPGVHGRMIDLCRPSNRKYEQAISIALGRNLDAIVVEQEATAIACIQYLKEQRAGQATFIPLDTIQAGEGTGKRDVAKMVEGCRSVLEVLRYESIYERAFSYACGSAVVCDTLEVAKNLCYERGIKVKAITLDGTIIHKSGLMTGGVQGRATGRWEEREIHQLKQERDACLATLQENAKSLRRTDAKERLQQRLIELQARQAFVNEELKAHQTRLAGVQEESMHISQEIERCESQLLQIDHTLSKHEKELNSWRTAINKAEDAIFSKFCAKIGFGDIREFENSRASLYQEIADRRLQFASVQAKLQHQSTFLQQQRKLAEERAQEAMARIAELQNEVATLEKEQMTIEARVERKRAKVATLQSELEKLRTADSLKEESISEARTNLTEAQQKLTALSKEVTGLECEVDRLLGSRKLTLRTCKMEEIDLPLMQSGTFADADIDVDQSVSPILLNFSILTRQQRASSDAAAERKFADRLRVVQEELEKLAPNLRALKKLEGTENRLKSTLDSFEKTKEELRKAKEEFSAVRAKRLERFEAAFKQISSSIDSIYKELTRTDLVPTGGSAFLSLEDTEEPFKEGIRFHAMPPMKRFLDMDQLSGGERTVAALALLFAIHTCRPSPFFILDEIDAALDSANVHRVTEFIRRRAQGIPLTIAEPHTQVSLLGASSDSSPASQRSTAVTMSLPVQFLVISLKASLYGRAESLVGIYRDPEDLGSRVLTLRLAEYPE